ncbi:MucR family transcriptional regulator [Phenylobacterium sp. LjRoot219]|uniref:MucR family transcriptional regulator n=1 Tax=Phenylobacterium sp. LjRoot219 TaxID=3342283 RepID=UPI003F5098D9
MSDEFKALVAEVAAAYFAKNHVTPPEIPTVISRIATSLSSVGVATTHPAEPEADAPKLTSAQIRKSITRDALISFEDNKPYKTLRRHLAAKGLTPQQYREKWGLPKDYPMAAPSYSEARAEMARSIGLGSRVSAPTKPPTVREGNAARPVEAAPLSAAPTAAYAQASVSPIQREAGTMAMRSNLEAVGPPPASPTTSVETLTSAQIQRSMTPEALISFEDGKPYKQLKRHLTARGMTPDDYRAKWGLPPDYPMVAANLSAARSAAAIGSGFGKKAAPSGAPTNAATPTAAASSIEPSHEPPRRAPTEVREAEPPALLGEPAAATKPARARIPGRLGLFGRRSETA